MGFSVNRRLLPVKATYFFTLAAVASLLPYLAVYMKQAGLSPIETSIIYACMPFVGALCRPIFGAIADLFKKHKAVLMICCIVTGVLHAVLLVVPHKPKPEPEAPFVPMELTCMDDGYRLHLCPHFIPELNDRCDVNKSSILSGRYPDPLKNAVNCSMHCHFIERGPHTRICFQSNDNHSIEKCAIDPLDFPSKNKWYKKMIGTLLNHLQKLFPVHFKMPDGFMYVSQQSGDNSTGVCHNYNMHNFIYKDSEYENYNIRCHNITSGTPETLKCHMTCDYPESVFDFNGYTCKNLETSYDKVFWMFFFIYLAAQIFFAPIFSLIDALTYDFLGEARSKWGVQRLWGTIGFAIFAVISALSVHYYWGYDESHQYTATFALFAVLNFIAAVIVCFYDVSDNVKCNQIVGSVIDLFKRSDVCILIAMVFTFGCYNGVIETFLFWHLHQLGGTQVVMGLAIAMQCLPEIIVLLFSGWLITKIGHTYVLYIVYVASFIRLLSYSFLVNPWWVLAIEPLHSITFALMYAAASSYGSSVTPLGMHGTIQGLIGGVYFGLGKGVGGTLAGPLMQHYGAAVMWRCYAVSALVFLPAAFAAHCFIVPAPEHQAVSTKEDREDTFPRNGSQRPRVNEMREMGMDNDLDNVGFDQDKDILVENPGFRSVIT